MAHDERIAIIGSGCRFPGSSNSPAKLWSLLRAPHDLATKIPADRFNIDAFFHRNNKHHGTTNAQESYFLSEDCHRFDASFFNISSTEAESIDPQQRILLETVYESLESAGLRLEDMQGSHTGVFCGVMCDDYGGILYRDIDALPQYTATGTARSILSNRVSYFFDWNGPSMTIDTACSSSLVAVNLAVKALRDGDCPVAVAAGANLILSPNMYVSESNLSMLSPTGRSRMWDAAADGYARGEGIAAVVLKRLDQAIADGDSIECVIRACNVNQDGRSQGITMPSSVAQTQLIRSTYAKAGLDISKAEDRCQYFEAHGTGTPAGDPQEASAIKEAFFSSENSADYNKLYVGSVKTVIGHTEGTAGLAGLIKASQAIQKGMIPPNLHFNRLNPRLEPFYHHLQVPTQLLQWPELPEGVPRRASVNSFGFGGTNAHVILESFDNTQREAVAAQAAVTLPFVFSAPSERALTAVLSTYTSFLKEQNEIDLVDLAWSLFARRSAFTYKISFSAQSITALCEQIDAELELRKGGQFASVSSRLVTKAKRILGVFTGQGAQWPKMGYDLICSSSAARNRFAELQEALDTLPSEHRPQFSLLEELAAPKGQSRLGEAALSQPLCTAVQVVLVDLLRAAGVTFSSVIGHSSGEIAAAYSAGFISATEAIRIAYYRGFFAKMAGSNGKKGSMLAAGMDFDQARELCARPEFVGRVQPAASNSSASVTLSGDADAIKEVEQVLKAEEKFARALLVDTAYHSHHMIPCSDPYVAALQACAIEPREAAECKWFSSVYDGQLMQASQSLQGVYWKDNMVNSVLFSQALTAALQDGEAYDLVLEVGPHPALKGPAQQTISDISGVSEGYPYSGVLKRGASDIEAFTAALGTIWSHIGVQPSTLPEYLACFDGFREPKIVKPLPNYPFDHDRVYWAESRSSKAFHRKRDPPNLLLGSMIPDAGDGEWRWRNYLRRDEIDWLDGHRIQSQTVFPATGYVAMALEAANFVARDRDVSLIEIDDLVIGRAISFTEDWAGVEILFKLDGLLTDKTGTVTTAHFACYANQGGTLILCTEGKLRIIYGEPCARTLPGRLPRELDLIQVDIPAFYRYLDELGYGYTGLFQGVKSLARKKDAASGLLSNVCREDPEPALMHHPAMMDTLLQTLLASVGHPGDGRLFSLHVPTSIEKVIINPYYCGQRCQELGTMLAFDAFLTDYTTHGVRGDIDLFDREGNAAVIQMEGVHVSPLMAPNPTEDRLLFSEVVWGPMFANAAISPATPPPSQPELAKLAEKLCLAYLKQTREQITEADRAAAEGSRKRAIQWVDDAFIRHKNVIAINDPPEVLEASLSGIESQPEFRLIRAIGKNLLPFIQGKISMRDELNEGEPLSSFINKSEDLLAMRSSLAELAGQISFRFPRMKILEIGAGSGETTEQILDRIKDSYHSYTFTDQSNEGFQSCRERFAAHSERMLFKTMDLEQDPIKQGFEEHTYDLVIASNILSTTEHLDGCFANIRRLMKPGGYALILEGVDRGNARVPFICGGLEKSWGLSQGGNISGSIPTPSEWDLLLREGGFSGLNSISDEHETCILPFSVFLSQADDDNIQRLRDPLSYPGEFEVLDELVIIGGNTSKTANLVKQVQELLAPRFAHIRIAQDLDSLDMSKSTLSTVLSLTELDAPVFYGIDHHRLESFKALTNSVKNLIWVSGGSSSDKLYESMTPAVLRSVAYELPHMHYQFLRIVEMDQIDPNLVANQVLRVTTIDLYNEISCPNMLWTTEPEISMEKGRPYIPRIRNDDLMNRRYMAARRVVKDEINLDEAAVSIVPVGDVYETQPITKMEDLTASHVSIRVLFSTLTCMKTKNGEYLYLVCGRETGSNKSFLAFSTTNASSIIVPSYCAMECMVKQGEEADFLSKTAYFLIADYLLSCATPHSSLLVHEPDQALQDAITSRARTQNIQPFFTTGKPECESEGLTYLHPRSSARLLKSILPRDVSAFVNLQDTISPLSARIKKLVPVTSKFEDRKSLLGTSAAFQTGPVDHTTAESLHMASLMSMTSSMNPTKMGLEVIDISEVAGTSRARDSLRIVDWSKTTELTVKIQSASSHVHLQSDKTYLLVGMTGDLGRSLCKWMITRGARHIVLTSRKPKVDPEWISQMAELGAKVKILPMDVTNKVSVREADMMIRESLPPVGGVINGAMVMNDVLFSDLSIDALHSTLKPKVEGSLFLNDQYWGADLDFFILFGSLAAVAGNHGQSAYAAANTFMSSLVQKRRAHGLPASIVNPGEIRGVGYVARLGQDLQDDLATLGYLSMSEQDLHEMFAEAILAGDPASERNPEVVAGPVQNDPQETPDRIWYSNPLLWDFIVYNISATTGGSSDNSLSIREQLKSLTEENDVHAAIVEAFIAKLRSKLQLSEDDHVDQDTLLVELGVDSLTAVDLRAWFVKELSTDMPVLKIVGGSSIAQLAEEATNKLPASVAPNFKVAENADASKPQEEASQPPKAAPKPEAKPQRPAPPVAIEEKQEEQRPESPVTTEHEQEEQRPKFDRAPVSYLSQLSLEDSALDSSASVLSSGSSKEEISDISSQSEVESPVTKPNYQRIEKLSYAQSRYWFLTQYLEDKTAYNVTLDERVCGTFPIEDLQKAFQLVANRHESLRTCYIEGPGGASDPRQAIMPSSRLYLETCTVNSEEEAHEEFVKIRDHVYDLEHGEVARARFVSIGADLHHFIVGYHHMCLDAASFHIFLKEIELTFMKQKLPPVSMQYTDYSVAQRTAFETGKLDKQLAYWKAEFPDQPEPLPLLPMAKVRSRPVLKKYELDELSYRIDTATVAKIRAGCKKVRSTPFHFFLAVLRVALQRFVETDDICIGVADANRLDSSTESIIGFLLNLLPLRFQSNSGNETFEKVLASTREKAYGALRNSSIPFDKLLDVLGVPRSTAHSPLFQVLMDWQPVTKDVNTFATYKSETQELSAGNTPYDLTLLCTESRGDFIVKFRTQKGLYDRNGSELFARSYLKLVEDFANDFKGVVGENQLYQSVDQDAALVAGKGRDMASSWPDTLSKRIEQLCESQPDSPAVKDGEKSYTYGELNFRSDCIANRLIQAGVTQGTAVTLFQHPTADWVCSMLAIWKINAIYVPLDLRAPLPRLATMVADCSPAVVLSHNETHCDVDGLSLPTAQIINVDEMVFEAPASKIVNASQPDSRAVILYTSGSTGKPKGIMLRHSSLKSQVEGYGSEWGLQCENVLQQGAMTFNHSLDQIFSGICNGGKVYMVRRGLRGDPIGLSKLIADEGITYTKATPSEYAGWLTYGADSLRTATQWKFAFGGGEHFTTSLARAFKALQLPQLRLYNSYGPGEITISSHKMEIPYKNVDDYEGNVYPVGYSLPNYSTYIVDKNLRIVPNGVSGEILVGGSGPCFGYLNKEALNKEKFVKNPFATSTYLKQGWDMAYRTFDRGHLLKDGSLVIEGRLDGDTQIKLRGIRIELEDIENAIIEASSGYLNQAVVTLRGEESQFLAAHVGFSTQFESEDLEDKEKFLKALIPKLPLPQYMCPAVTVPLETFPLNVHGKVDRKAVNALELTRISSETDAGHDLNEAEIKLRGIWSQVLDERVIDVMSVGRETNFFLSGGNSVLLVKLQALILQQLSVTIPLMELFESSTLGEMATKVQTTSQVTAIDWAAETALDNVVANLRPLRRVRETRAGMSIVLTGATGFLGRSVLQALCDSPAVAAVHAVAVRARADGESRVDISSPKLVVHNGDLTAPLLGLSLEAFDDLAAGADAIIHCGANRSFWDTYPLLRRTNVESTRTIISLGARRRIPIHYLSSGAVADITDQPPADGSDGYVASKWASEQLLAHASAQLGLPVTIHRPTTAAETRAPDDALMLALQKTIEIMRCIPTQGGWSGSFAMMPVADVAGTIRDAVEGTQPPPAAGPAMVVHTADMTVGTDDVVSMVQGMDKYRDFEKVPAVRWLGRAKKEGFAYLVAGQDALVGRREAGPANVRSRR